MSIKNGITNQNMLREDPFKKLSCRTKGNRNPQGKERVYFTCHPEDFDACFDPICQEIFETQNCAIYYKEDMNTAWGAEEMETDLGRMQLFVIPITSKFLYHDNLARDEEFRFAVEHHIPILPLMQEGGLDKEFNRICGDLQFLDKNALENDPTALPYEKKLENFLSSVLLGEELAAKVRDAFDAYIFMSYRKKDRKYAQELMRLIHKNDFCRDIAIWYDEFLVPGENFNQAIRDAMEKSELFTFVVTPSILEPNNYVMMTEYPEARNAGKPILPAEMEPTDREMLNKYFKNIPDPTDVYDNQALTDYLIEKISKFDIMENSSDPIHLFFIGLAYLSGIDVEVDYERAVNLITTAAEANLPEAMKKLSDMYKNGEGVERDYETSAMWLEKLAEYWEKKFTESGLEADGNKYYGVLMNVGDAWYGMYQLNQSRLAYEKMLSAVNGLFEKFGGADKKHKRSMCFIKLGINSQEEGNLNEAKEWYRKSLKLSEELRLETGTVEARRDLYVSYGNLGNISQAEGNLNEAKKLFQKCLELSEELYRETGTVKAQQDLALSYIKLGKICQAEGSFNEAKVWSRKSLKLREELSQETGTVEARRNLCLSYGDLGNISKAEGNFNETRECYQKCLELSEELYRETGTVEARLDLSISYGNLGVISQEEGNLNEAKKWYRKSLELQAELSQETGTVEVIRDLSFSYEKLGGISRAEGNFDEAKEWFQKSLKLSEELRLETGTVKARWDLSISCENMGNISRAEGNLVEAKEWYQKSLELREELRRETGTVEARRYLSVGYDNMGNISRAEGNLLEAKEWYRKSLELREELCRETGTVEARRDLSVGYDKKGNISWAEENLVEAKEWYRKSLELREELCRETGTVEAGRDLSVGYDKMGNISQTEGKPGEAKEWYRKSLELREELCSETGTVEARRNLSVGYEKMGNVSQTEGALNEAKEWYRKSLELREELCRETGTVGVLDDYAVSCCKLGILDRNHLDVSLLREAESIWVQLVQSCPQMARYAKNLRKVQNLLKNKNK